MRRSIVFSLLIAGSAIAAPPRKPTSSPATKATAAPTTAAPTTPAPAPPTTTRDTRSAATLIAEARALYDALEYDKVAPLAALALAAPDITLEQKLVAYQLQGSALAIIGDPVDAERPFLLLLSVRPDFVVPDDTPPKIKSVFAKVKGEFDAVREAQEAQQRKELAATIEIDGALPTSADGGRPLRFDFGVADPRGVVKSVRVQYRRQGEPEFLGLPLRRAPSGRWVGVVPGEWTASEQGFTMEALVVVADQKGQLKSLGAPASPITVSAGALARKQPVPVWALGTSAGLTGAVALAATGITAATAWQNADFHAKLDAATPENPASGADIVAQQRLGESLNVAALAGWGTAGVAAIVTGVLALFTNWSGEELDDAPAPTTSTEGPAAAAR
jgi:hypothetical protein